MGGHRLSVHLDRFDLVRTVAVIGVGVEELRVAVTLLDRSDFASLFPSRSPLLQRESETVLAEAPEQLFTCSQTSAFLCGVK